MGTVMDGESSPVNKSLTQKYNRRGVGRVAAEAKIWRGGVADPVCRTADDMTGEASRGGCGNRVG